MTVLSDFAGQNPADIFEVQYDGAGLRVSVSPDDDGLTAFFEDAIGFRLLDEGDLLEFWSDDDYESQGWIYEVHSGGWFDFESSRKGFFSSSDRTDLKEFLVATSNDCLSVLAFSTPRLAT